MINLIIEAILRENMGLDTVYDIFVSEYAKASIPGKREAKFLKLAK